MKKSFRIVAEENRDSTERKERGDERSESQDKRNRIFVESSVWRWKSRLLGENRLL